MAEPILFHSEVESQDTSVGQREPGAASSCARSVNAKRALPVPPGKRNGNSFAGPAGRIIKAGLLQEHPQEKSAAHRVAGCRPRAAYRSDRETSPQFRPLSYTHSCRPLRSLKNPTGPSPSSGPRPANAAHILLPPFPRRSTIHPMG